ncbi:DNA integrity scanning protein DisA nucleotide-binding domain protein [Hymenobacter defluvii]|uniref:DNA integrity scanning protein DisA nucleotide-binding domain protein n=1 Tax=Hymenobacter defluvii TaxID=2054411 RepID=A0ABS3TH10_9BACT|nr:diadenylate cyclase [Hymenobacter defluvii]MBO3272913.1 DNA integrity scanning protein DisA nucleotide-binding domain protein [Hymenobacter defluvii]
MLTTLPLLAAPPVAPGLPTPSPDPTLIWPYQAHFRQAAQTMADGVFDALDEDLQPRVQLLAVPSIDNATGLASLLGSDTSEYDPSAFSDVHTRCQHLHDRGSWILTERTEQTPEEPVRRRYEGYVLRLAVQEILDEHDKVHLTRASFAGWPVLINDYHVVPVLQLNRKTVRRHPTLRPDRFYTNGRPVIPSLIQAAIIRFHEECAKSLSEPEPGAGLLVRPRETDELVRAAGTLFMQTPAQDLGISKAEAKLYATLNTISSLRYEGMEGVGKMMLAARHHPNLEEVFALTCPTPLSDYRAVRKLLEMTTPDVSLLADGENVYALGRQIGHYDASREDLFVISFVTHYAWEFQHAGKVLMRTHYGQPSLARARLNRSSFRKELRRTFDLTNPEKVERLWEVAAEASRQKHGTLLVITTEALAEADRLKLQCTLIEPVPLTPLITRLVTAIDGAVLLDPESYCYSIGVILDGTATGRGNSTRGARYNSAIRYVQSSPYPCMAIVVSEDGLVDVLTKESLEEE